MIPRDIKVGETYRLSSSSDYGYLKAIEIIPSRTRENTKTYTVIKCEFTENRNDKVGFIRYFRPCDMIKLG